jgi:hypothetical protein
VGREAPIAHVAHRVVGHAGEFAPCRADQRQPETGERSGPGENARVETCCAALCRGDPRLRDVDASRQVPLGQVGTASYTTQRSRKVEVRHRRLGHRISVVTGAPVGVP